MTPEEQTGYDEAQRRIATWLQNGRKVNILDLSGLGLEALPPEINQLSTLRHLLLARNSLKALPSEIGQLLALTYLDLSDNEIEVLPPEIGQFSALTHLLLARNSLNALPSEIGQLTELLELRLDYNNFDVLPPVVSTLRTLTRLDIDNNELSELSPAIAELRSLETLYLFSNKLRALPSGIGQLTKLNGFYLSNNQLTELPPEIGHLRELAKLHLYYNRLETLPAEISQLTSLTELLLHDNPKLGIPDAVLGPPVEEVYRPNDSERKSAARPADIINFYFNQREAAAAGTLRAVGEVKVMLVGRGGAGKTSLRRFFLNKKHNAKEPETPGIALDNFSLSCGRRNVAVRLWDFAGQEITHALHQFFLTEGCVYVLVLDPRSDTEMRDAEYWLGLLRRYASGAPVVVALNRQDARQGGYDVDRRVLRENFPAIRGFVPTNCETRTGCEELRTLLRQVIADLPATEPPHLQVPDSWRAVMRDCSAKGKKRQHLTLEEFREICRQHGETEPEKQTSLARLLHQLGAVLHFVDEPRLRDTSVLKPYWVTDAVYRLLRFKDQPGSDGTLTLAEAQAALPGESEKAVRFLLRLMERFEMCFPVDEEEGGKPTTTWLVPGALDKFQPENVGLDWQEPGSVRMRYVYDPLPEGVIPRFIVRTHLLSEQEPRWRNGVVLRDGGAAALVRRAEKRNHVEVIAFGPPDERLRLLEIIQGNLERINADVPDPKPFAEQEVDGVPGVFRRVAELEAAESNKVPVVIKTDKIEAVVEPTPQLNRTSESAARDPARVPLKTFLSYSHEDKRVKTIFQQNLAVMMKKNFITSWDDGLIEPGTLWREDIEANLERMDLFVGLLTNAFLLSDFIDKVEINAARQKLREKGRDFLFVLILVDDISLDGLDLAQYQILRPGGKAVEKHASRKAGFNQAQKELEKLIAKRQKEKKAERRDNEPRIERGESKIVPKEGVTIIIERGDYIRGNKPMNDDHSIHIGGNVNNSQVGQTLTNCTNMIQQQAPGERKDLLEQVQREAREIIDKLPEERQAAAADDFELLVKGADEKKPNRRWYSMSAEGLLEASKFVKDFSGNIAGTLGQLGKLIWPDFTLPEE